MPNSVTSPSDFIYRRTRRSSYNLTTLDEPAMEPRNSIALDTCQQHEPLMSTHAPRETAERGLHSPGQTGQQATCQNGQFIQEDKSRLPPGFPYENHGSSVDIHPLCPACHHKTEPLNATSIGCPREIATGHLRLESAYLPSNNTNSQYATDTSSDRLPHPVFEGLASPLTSVHHFTPPSDQHSSAAASSTDSRTISIPSNSAESIRQLCAAVHAVHDICLQSSKTYLETHLANHRARASNLSSLASRSTGCMDGAGSSCSNSSNGGKGKCEDCSPIPPSTNSLLKNVSSVCNMLWTVSQRDRLDVLNVERMAVDNMSHLLCWAETVALGDYDEWRLADEEALWQVLEAGRNLCAWLGVPDGIQAMDALMESDPTGMEYGVI
ncbi:hypothetical protein F4677DRAFT_211622 [Hypoxylon crocopeplum]|nr:hypothetical protein F4677DRAFT_211622 [Hypoxylon crocopeplum]